MKKSILAATLSALVLSTTPVLAQPPPPADKGAQAEPAAPNVQAFDEQMAKVQENMKEMQEQMDKVRQTQDPQARQKLLQDHWTTMQDNMQRMHGMWGSGGMGGPGGQGGMGGPGMGPGKMMGGPMMGWGHMSDYYSKLTPEQQKQRQYMMDQYMPMQQMMTDQMMQHQQYRWMK